MTDSNDWFQKSINSLALNGKAERTQEAYTRALRMLCEFYGGRSPEAITEAELEAYFLHRKNVDRWSSNTMRICYCGICFYFVKVLQRNWQLFNYLRAKSESRLLFPAWGRDSRSAAASQTPMAKSSVQGAFRRAKFEAGIKKLLAFGSAKT